MQTFPPPAGFAGKQTSARAALIAAAAAAVGAAVGSTGPWVSVGFLSMSGLDTSWWGRSALIASCLAAILAVSLLIRPTAVTAKWSVPVAWLAAVLGVACLALSVPVLIRVFAAPRTTVLGIPIGANPGWGMWLLTVSSGALTVAATVAAQAISRAVDAHRARFAAPGTWTGYWQAAAILVSALLVVSSAVYQVAHWKSGDTGFTGDGGQMAEPTWPSLSDSPPSSDDTTAQTSPVPTTTSTTTTSAVPPIVCGVDLKAPAVRRAVRLVQPIAQYPLDPDWAWGNYDPCVSLSVALVPTAMGTGSSPVQALMFHYGEYVGSPTGQGVGYLRFNQKLTTSQTIVLTYRMTLGSCGGCDDATWADVRFQLKNGQIVNLDPIPQMR